MVCVGNKEVGWVSKHTVQLRIKGSVRNPKVRRVSLHHLFCVFPMRNSYSIHVSESFISLGLSRETAGFPGVGQPLAPARWHCCRSFSLSSPSKVVCVSVCTRACGSVCVTAVCLRVCACACVLGIPGLGLAESQSTFCSSASLELLLRIEVIAAEGSLCMASVDSVFGHQMLGSYEVTRTVLALLIG